MRLRLAAAPGSIDTILSGGEPNETGPTPRARNTTAPAQVPTEELLLELRRRIIAPRDRRPESWDDWDGGLDPLGDWHEQGLTAAPDRFPARP